MVSSKTAHEQEGRKGRKEKKWKRKEGFAERRSEQVTTVSAQNP